MAETVERLASIEAHQDAMRGTLDKISGFLERSVTERTAQHTETVRQLAVIENNQKLVKEDLQTYQKECTEDREDLSKQVENIKSIQSNQAGKVAGIAMAISTIVAAGGFLVEWLKK